MQPHLTDADLQISCNRLKSELSAFKPEAACLSAAFESASKHMPVYLKIIKGHIEQLAKVLQLETHNHRSLENAGLAEPVIQLIKLFSKLTEEDIKLLEILAEEARNGAFIAREEKHFSTEATHIATEA